MGEIDPSTDYGDEAKLGPAMRILTDRQRRFAVAMLKTGRHNHARCAEMAGYSTTGASIGAAAYRLAHDYRIQDAIQELAQNELASAKLVAVRAIIDTAEDPTHKDRLKAAESILDRTGMPPVKEVKHRVEKIETKLDKAKKIVELAKALGQDPHLLLGTAIDLSPAEWQELLPPLVALPIPVGTEGLEDLL